MEVPPSLQFFWICSFLSFVSVSVSLNVCICAIFMDACGGQRRAVELLVLQLEAVVSHPVNSGN